LTYHNRITTAVCHTDSTFARQAHNMDHTREWLSYSYVVD